MTLFAGSIGHPLNAEDILILRGLLSTAEDMLKQKRANGVRLSASETGFFFSWKDGHGETRGVEFGPSSVFQSDLSPKCADPGTPSGRPQGWGKT